MISSRDVVFDEESTWDWETQEDEQYDFFPSFTESWEESEEPQEPMTPPPSPPQNQEDPSSEESSSERPHRMKNLQELYEVTANQDNLTLFCLFADCEPLGFEEAVQSKRWRDAMDEEIQAIKKNDTWELANLPKGHKAIGVK